MQDARVLLDNGHGNQGEAVLRPRNKSGKVVEINFAGYKLLPEAAIVAEMRKRCRVVGACRVSGASPKKLLRQARRAIAPQPR